MNWKVKRKSENECEFYFLSQVVNIHIFNLSTFFEKKNERQSNKK